MKIKERVPLKNLTTFNVGGRARYFADVKNYDELSNAIGFSKIQNIPVFVLGGGSDILVSDRGFKGLVIRYNGKSLEFNEKKSYVLVTAEAGLKWDKLVEASVARNLQGIECLSGIPGSVGAAPIQNIGAYGQELKNTFVNLTAYDIKKQKFIQLDKKDCGFDYRESIFKKSGNKGYIIVDVTLKLNKRKSPTISYQSLIDYLKEHEIGAPSLREVREAILKIRENKFENYLETPNAGSFFKNPVIEHSKLKNLKRLYPNIPYFEYANRKYKCFAGWFIEKAGWKGKKYGNAAVSAKHALVLINPKKLAKASEIKTLAKKISDDVYRKFKVRLEPEVQFIGFE